MIDTCLYRFRIGAFNARVKGNGSRTITVSNTGNNLTDNGFFNIINLLLYLTVYLYFSICIWGVIVCMLRECKFSSFTINRFHRISDTECIYSFLTHSKLLSVVLMYYILKRDVISYRFFGIYFGLLRKLSFHGLSAKRTGTNVSTIRFIARNITVLCSW